MQTAKQFDVAALKFYEDESTPLSRLLAALRALVDEYGEGRAIRGDREGRVIRAGFWNGKSHGFDNTWSATFDCEVDAIDYRMNAARLIEESGLTGETSISGRFAVWTVYVELTESES